MTDETEAPAEALPLVTNRCGTCRWWKRKPGNVMNLGAPQVGTCYGGPPQVVVVPSASGPALNAMWPPTSSNEFCGQHRPKLDA